VVVPLAVNYLAFHVVGEAGAVGVTSVVGARPRGRVASGMLMTMTWAALPRRARAFRVFHAVYSVFGLSAMGYLWACVITGRRDRGLAASIGFLAMEGGALIVGRGNCPMGPLQEEWGDPVPFFELVLPPRAAKAAVPCLAGVSILGMGLILLRGTTASPVAVHGRGPGGTGRRA
jgi:hypothetical protein